MGEQIRFHIAHYGAADLLATLIMVLDIETSINCSNGSIKSAKATAELADALDKAKEAFQKRISATH